MIKNLSTNQILLIAMATVVLLLAALSFYLLLDPSAPLPFTPPSPSSTITLLPPSPSYTPAPSSTSIPTRQTSYTPFASPATTDTGTPVEGTGTSETVSPVPSGTITPPLPTNTSTLQPLVTTSVSPTASQTLTAGEYEVIGRVVQNGTPVANVVVEFADDAPPRKNTTNSGGHYSFISLAPGTNFTLAFKQVDNPQLTQVPDIASLAWIEGSLPSGISIIDLPDLEMSLNLEGMIFRLIAPADGAPFSEAVISPSNPLQFTWTLYNQGNSYHIELGANGSDEPVWNSGDTTSTSLMWNGTLNDGNHISVGAYWWRVAVNKSLGNYRLVAFTQKWDLIFNP
jgi:hypothetical protein